MKWKQVIPVWLILFLIAPSIWFHRLLMIGGRPPDAPPFAPPLFVPFGAVNYGGDFFNQLARGDFVDSLMILVLLILPILVYTYVVSAIISYSFNKVRT